MADNHRGRRPHRPSRQNIRTQQQRRRHLPGYREMPPSTEDEATGSMEDGMTLGEERGSYPAYAQSGADISMETPTYRNDIQPTRPSPSTTDFDTSAYVSSAGFLDSSLSTPQGVRYIDTTAYDPVISNYGSGPPDLSSGYPVMGTSTEWTGSFQNHSALTGGYAATTPMSDVTISYTHAEISSYSISIAPSPPNIEAPDGNGISYTTSDAFVQDQGPPSHVSQNSYDSSYGRRWSTDNQHGSVAGSPEQTVTEIMETQLKEEEQNSERLRENSIGAYVRNSQDPWSPATVHNNVHDTSNSYFYRTSSSNADGNERNY